MGILCKIRLHRPPNGMFTPNGIVSGVINYSVDKPLSMKTITVSLKGSGRLVIEEKNKDSKTYHTAEEEYVKIENNVLEKQTDTLIPIGSYEIPFKFILPEDIPATLDYHYFGLRNVTCKIIYSVRIHFATLGRFSFDKKFKQQIVVVRNKLTYPRYPTELIIYGERKKLFHFIKNNFVNIKVKMFNSIIPPGGTVNLEYEVWNKSDLQLKGVEVKIMEMYTFTTKHLEEKQYKDIPNISIHSGSIAENQTEKIPLSLVVPPEAASFECSKIVCKDYVISVTVKIPGPHKNLTVIVPFQIGNQPGENPGTDLEADCEDDDEPPPYWEAMGEYNSEDA